MLIVNVMEIQQKSELIITDNWHFEIWKHSSPLPNGIFEQQRAVNAS